jgi:hypothetical protein
VSALEIPDRHTPPGQKTDRPHVSKLPLRRWRLIALVGIGGLTYRPRGPCRGIIQGVERPIDGVGLAFGRGVAAIVEDPGLGVATGEPTRLVPEAGRVIGVTDVAGGVFVGGGSTSSIVNRSLPVATEPAILLTTGTGVGVLGAAPTATTTTVPTGRGSDMSTINKSPNGRTEVAFAPITATSARQTVTQTRRALIAATVVRRTT